MGCRVSGCRLLARFDVAVAGLGKECRDRAGRQGRAEEKALNLGTTLLADQIELIGGLNALGRGGHAEAAAKADDRPDDRDAVGLRGDILHERAIDLDLVEGKGAQVAEAGIAGAEIVKRNADTNAAKTMKRGERRVVAGEQRRLGHLQFESPGRETGI